MDERLRALLMTPIERPRPFDSLRWDVDGRVYVTRDGVESCAGRVEPGGSLDIGGAIVSRSTRGAWCFAEA